ncbi:hypothetical protein TNIN_472981 [Trichonephila inaurata madagascariensis]|uniref:DUF7041 domain-containing protein n=1 Tax=Trichonephila inaurata madagascariensis TaxID=2747483 RepID=A0A8X6XS20_9ARAC|nr:hypothetical protein TNIN_472981 [Trichonephila inaurata madagascariensis]
MVNNSEDSKFESKKDATDSIARVSAKVLPFWKPDPGIWFMQIKAQFQNSKITADTSATFLIQPVKPESHPVMAAALSAHMPTQKDHFSFVLIYNYPVTWNISAPVVLVGKNSAHNKSSCT